MKATTRNVMHIRLSKICIISTIVLLFAAPMLLTACGAEPYVVPDLTESVAETPAPYEEEEDLSVYDYIFDDGYIESEHEYGGENDVVTDTQLDSVNVTDYFEIFTIEGTAESMTGDSWERMLRWRSNAISLAEQYRDDVIINMNPVENIVYLTFDDGPDAVNTVSVVNTLQEYGVSATFFFTGENIRRHGDVVRLTHDAGFSIGLHGYSHKSFQELTAEEIIAELNENNDLLEAITGERATIMRPPYGAVGTDEINTISNLNLTIYLWSLDTLDWAQSDQNEILQNIKEYLRPGDIILMHAFSGQKLVPEILPSIIEFIKNEGFEMRALPQ